MKFLFFVVISCMVFQFTTAQETIKKSNDYKLAVRFNPLSLFDPVETNLSVGIDMKLRKKLSLGGDVAVYIARNVYAQSRPMSGFYVRPTLRWYSNNRLYMFTELVLMYKHTARKENDWLGMDCVNGVAAYEKFTQYKEVRDVFDLSFRAGMRENLFQSENWFFEFYMGIGLRQKLHSLKYNEKNTCATTAAGEFFNILNQNPSGNFTTLSIPAGMRLVWVLQ